METDFRKAFFTVLVLHNYTVQEELTKNLVHCDVVKPILFYFLPCDKFETQEINEVYIFSCFHGGVFLHKLFKE